MTVIIIMNQVIADKLKEYHFGFPFLRKNLDILVFKGQGREKGSVLEKIVLNKTKTLKATVKALLEELTLRENLNTSLILKIDEDISEQDIKLRRLENLRLPYSTDIFFESTKIKGKLERNILELNREKRREYLECWKDLMILKKYLMSALREYWDMIKRREVLSGN